MRESNLSIITVAGKEIGVASTKAFTTQLSILSLLAITFARHRGLAEQEEALLVEDLHHLPGIIEETLKLDGLIAKISNDFAEKHHALFFFR